MLQPLTGREKYATYTAYLCLARTGTATGMYGVQGAGELTLYR